MDTTILHRDYDLLDSLLDGDHCKPVFLVSAEQELAILVMRDTLGYVLGLQPGACNIETNLKRLAELARKVKEIESLSTTTEETN